MNGTIPIPALACSVALHASLLAWTLCPSASLPQQQVVDIELVAMSSLTSNQEVRQAKPDPQPEKAVPAVAASPLQKESTHRKMAAVITSGPQAPHALKKVAALVEPVFNAAYLHNTPPAYPDTARREGVEGRVLLEIDVTPQGRAGDVTVQHSSGSPVLDNAAREAVKNWRFVPARRGDEMLESKVTVPIEFKLE